MANVTEIVQSLIERIEKLEKENQELKKAIENGFKYTPWHGESSELAKSIAKALSDWTDNTELH